MSSQRKKSEESKKNLYNCFACKDTSWIIDFSGRATRCKCFEHQSIEAQWEASGLVIDDIDKTFKTYEANTEVTKKLKNTASNYWFSYEKNKDTKHNSILLCGSPGCGKTHLSIALANNFIKKGVKVVYLPYVEVMKKLKQNILDRNYYQRYIEKYKNAEILLLDDLWKGKVTDSDITIIFEIVNYRYINKKPIICSSEYLTEKMLSFDEAIGSRIYEMSKGHICEVSGRDNNHRVRGM